MNATVQAVTERYASVGEAIRKGQILKGESAALLADRYAYPIHKDALGIASFGAVNHRDGSINDAEKSIVFTVSTQVVDRDGDVVRSLGCNLDDYAKNDIWCWGHQSIEFPIGKSHGEDGQICVWPEENRIRAKCWFDRADEDAMLIYGKYQRGFLNSTSIAFVPLKAWRREQEFKAQHSESGPGWMFDEISLTEISCVAVPSNAQANVMRDIYDSEKSFMSPRLQKSWLPYCSVAKGSWTGWCPTGSTSDGNGGCVPCEKSVEKSRKRIKKKTVGDFSYELFEYKDDKAGVTEYSGVIWQGHLRVYEALSRSAPGSASTENEMTDWISAHKSAKKSCSCSSCKSGGTCGCGKAKGAVKKAAKKYEMSPAYAQGQHAAEVGKGDLENPYSKGSPSWHAWLEGFRSFTTKSLTPGQLRTKEAIQDCVSRKSKTLSVVAAYKQCSEKALGLGVTQKTLDAIRPHVVKAKKDLSELSGTTGGYTVPEESKADNPCPVCEGSGDDVFNTGQKCRACQGTGVAKSGRKPVTKDLHQFIQLVIDAAPYTLATAAFTPLISNAVQAMWKLGKTAAEVAAIIKDEVIGKSVGKGLTATTTEGFVTCPLCGGDDPGCPECEGTGLMVKSVRKATIITYPSGVSSSTAGHMTSSTSIDRVPPKVREAVIASPNGGKIEHGGDVYEWVKSLKSWRWVDVEMADGRKSGIRVPASDEGQAREMAMRTPGVARVVAIGPEQKGKAIQAKAFDTGDPVRVIDSGKTGRVFDVLPNGSRVTVLLDDGEKVTVTPDKLQAKSSKVKAMKKYLVKCAKGYVSKDFCIEYPSPGGPRYWDGSKWVSDQSQATKYSSESEAQSAFSAIGSNGGKVVQAKGYVSKADDDEFVDEADEAKEFPDEAEAQAKAEEVEGEVEEVPEPEKFKSSALEIGKAYVHHKNLDDYMTKAIEDMDHPGVEAGLTAHREEHIAPAMEHLKGLLEEHHSGADMEKVCKALETDGGDGLEGDVGENNLVNQGDIPPDPEETVIDKEDLRDSDPDTEEILERYQDPESKKWITRKVGQVRVTKDGRRFLVREKAASFHVGDWVTITYGSYAGSQGKVTSIEPNGAFVVKLENPETGYAPPGQPSVKVEGNELRAGKSLRRKPVAKFLVKTAKGYITKDGDFSDDEDEAKTFAKDDAEAVAGAMDGEVEQKASGTALCPHCHQTVSTDNATPGGLVTCPDCGGAFTPTFGKAEGDANDDLDHAGIVQMAEDTGDAAEYMGDMAEDDEVAMGFKGLLKHHSKRLGAVSKALMQKTDGDDCTGEDNDDPECGAMFNAVSGGKGFKALDNDDIEAVKCACDFMGDLSEDEAIPKRHKAATKHHAKRLGSVHKALTDAGKVQRDGGSGSALSDKGTTQSGGKKTGLADDGEEQRDGGAAKKYKAKALSPAVEQRFKKFEKTFQRITGIGLGEN